MVAWSLIYERNVSWRTRFWVLVNIVCFSYFALMTVSTTILCWTVILPNMYARDQEKLWKHRCFIIFTFINAVGNCVLCICSSTRVTGNKLSKGKNSLDKNCTKGITEVDKILNSTNNSCTKNVADAVKGHSTESENETTTIKDRQNNLKKESANANESKKRYLVVNTEPYECDRCDQLAPARSHHCPLCKTCILKRDHHCFFMTVCIGYYNQKYFIMHCFYMMLGTLYGMVLIAVHLKTWYNVTFYGPQTFITLFLDTFVKLAFNFYPSLSYIVLVLMLYGCLFAGISAAGLWFWQVQITMAGQTTREALKGFYEYSRGKRFNFKDVFGKFWVLTLVLPLPLPQMSDGWYMGLNKKT